MRVYKHVIEPWPNGREPRDATIYALARRLLSDGTIKAEDRLERRASPASCACGATLASLQSGRFVSRTEAA
jgi:hypothetical protein